MSKTGNLVTVVAEFTDRGDAEAFMQIARELGVVTRLNTRQVNYPDGRPMRERRLGKKLLASMLPGRSYDLEHFAAICEEHGYAPNSGAAVMSKCVAEGDVRRTGLGLYELVPQPRVCTAASHGSKLVACLDQGSDDCVLHGCIRTRVPNPRSDE